MGVDADLGGIDLTPPFHSIWDKTHVGIAVLDEQLRYAAVNSSLAEFNGIPPEQHLGKCVGEILGDVAQKVESAVRQVFNTGEPALNVEIVGELPARQGGRKRWIANYFPVDGPAGQVKQVAAIVVELQEHLCLASRDNGEIAAGDVVSNHHLLRSWKDIANYLGACVKTVQRWEEFHGLPIRRVAAARGSVVFAFKADLDKWMQSRCADAEAEGPYERMREIFLRFPVPAIVLDDQRVIIDTNDKAVHLLRTSKDQLAGKHFDFLVPSSTATYNDSEWDFFRKTGLSAGMRNMTRPDGSVFSAEYILKRVASGIHLITLTAVRAQSHRREAIFYEISGEELDAATTNNAAGV